MLTPFIEPLGLGTLPLTKTFQPRDLARLSAEVARSPGRTGLEAWAHAMGLRALAACPMDPFAKTVILTGVEPDFLSPHAWIDHLLAIGVLSHVPQWRQALKAYALALKPGGLLYLTLDYWHAEGPDTTWDAQTRLRIWNRESVQDILSVLRQHGVDRWGPVDWTYHGNYIAGEYTLLALTCRKRLGTLGDEMREQG
jgi:SAM-dependent methyltransferase